MTDLFNEKAKDWDANKMRKMLSSAIGSSILSPLVSRLVSLAPIKV